MANDRLYMRCRQCGEMVFLSKHLMSPWYIKPEQLDKINEFFEEHCYHFDKLIEVKPEEDLHPWNSFELVSECGDGFPEETDPIEYKYYDLDVYKHEPEFRESEIRKEAFEKSQKLSQEIEQEVKKEFEEEDA